MDKFTIVLLIANALLVGMAVRSDMSKSFILRSWSNEATLHGQSGLSSQAVMIDNTIIICAAFGILFDILLALVSGVLCVITCGFCTFLCIIPLFGLAELIQSARITITPTARR